MFLLLQSCSKSWLEAKVDLKQAVPATVKDFQAMLDNFTIMNQSSTSGSMEVAADGHYYTDAAWNTYKGTLVQNAYTWSANVPYNAVSSWNGPYTAIAYLNVILDESKKSTEEDAEELNSVIGQALFTRAFLFYQIAQEYAPPYDENNASNTLGIPLRLTSDIAIPSSLSTLKQTYDQIITDLNTAVDLLPIEQLYTTRGSRIAAFGLLARVYLTVGDHNNALTYSSRYLDLKHDLLDYSTISPTARFIGDNVEIAYLRLHSAGNQLTSNYLVSPDLMELYESGDLRKKVFFRANDVGYLFKGTYGRTATAMFAGIATDEIYLIRAECRARTGDLAGAMKDLNDLLRTRWEKNLDGTTMYEDQTASTETEALRIILEERRKQLILRNVRWSDLRRLNMDNRFKTTITRTVDGQTYTLEPGSFRYTFPIPQDIIAASGMQQNPGWE